MQEYSIKHIALLVILIVLNSITHEHISGAVIAIPQFVFVVYLLLNRKTETAFYYHLIFTITCLPMPFTTFANPDVITSGLYNYSKFKLINPIGIYHLILLLFIVVVLRKKSAIKKDSLYYSLYKTLLYLAISGMLIGVFTGIITGHIYVKHYIAYSVYMVTILATMFVLMRLHTPELLNKIFKLMIEVMIAAPIAALVTTFFGFTNSYSGLNIAIILDAVYFSMALIFAFYQLKHYQLPVFAFLITLYLLTDGGMGGKGIIFMGVVLLIFFSWTMLKKPILNVWAKNRRLILQLLIVPFILGIALFIWAVFDDKRYVLFIYKLENVWLMVNIFEGMEGLLKIPESPRVRFIEILNIVYEQLHNPFYLIFGKGYGSSFSEHFGLLPLLDSKFSYPANEIAANKMGAPHDTFSAIPLANGWLGFILIYRMVYKYFRRMRHNFLAFAAIPWLGFVFYYNPQFGIVAMLMLYASEKELNIKTNIK